MPLLVYPGQADHAASPIKAGALCRRDGLQNRPKNAQKDCTIGRPRATGASPQFVWDQPSASPKVTAMSVFVQTHVVVMGEVGTAW